MLKEGIDGYENDSKQDKTVKSPNNLGQKKFTIDSSQYEITNEDLQKIAALYLSLIHI